jgi:hypothetical protein
MSKGRITGIGGIFFKCDQPDHMREWYRDHFGLTPAYSTSNSVLRLRARPSSVVLSVRGRLSPNPW